MRKFVESQIIWIKKLIFFKKANDIYIYHIYLITIVYYSHLFNNNLLLLI